MDQTRTFYDDLAEVYHLIYEDWQASIERQADALTALIREHDPTARVVADVACGIGTQTLGLAARGYQVLASDLSAGAIARLQREALQRGLTVESRTDDMLRLDTFADRSADVLIACDNAVPHLLDDEQILQAFRQFHRVLRPRGLCMVSVRDYAALPETKVRFVPYGIREVPGGRVVVFQIWDYDGDRYELRLYFVVDEKQRIETRVFTSLYYAVSIDTLCRLLQEAGFHDIRRVDDKLFQPLIVAER